MIAMHCAACWSERQQSTYPSVLAARADGLFRRGWVPDVLPEDGGFIVEAHDLDTSARCSLAHFSATQTQEVTESLRRVGFLPCEAPPDAPPLPSCPFTESNLSRIPIVLCRPSGADREFAAVIPEGVSRNAATAFLKSSLV